VIQTALLCGCGGSLPCTKCERRARLSREMFGGEREAVLLRDGRQCQVCGDPEARRLVVHHRVPGQNERRWLVTLCRACHVRAHHTARPGVVLVLATPFLFRLWRELHPRQALQLLLAPAKADAVQAALFESAGNAA
jgi:HNH endonuclease